MHIAVSWQISANQPQWGTVNKRLIECLQAYSWICLINTVYVVRVTGDQQRSEILKNFKAIADRAHVDVDYTVSPITTGHYGGQLRGGVTWPMINDVAD